jgi:uncharacterized protein (DUF427 family)
MDELVERLQLKYLCKWYTNRSDLYYSALFRAAFNPNINWSYKYNDDDIKFVIYLKKAPNSYE